MSYRGRLWAIYQKIGLNINLKSNAIMKQLFSIFLLSAIIFGLVGCGGNQQERTSDLINYELKGNVKLCNKATYIVSINDKDTIREGDIQEETFIFSKNGILSKLGEQELMYDKQGNLVPNELLDSIVRNDKQQIVRMVYARKGEDGKPISFTCYTYNDNGYPATITGYYKGTIVDELKLAYDDSGKRIKSDIKSVYDEKCCVYSETFDYLEFDAHGNWVKRLCRRESNCRGNLLAMQRRAITYYGEDSESLSEEDMLLGEILTESDRITDEPFSEEEITPIIAPEAEESERESDIAFDVVEQMPEFPGGMSALMKYITTNLQYPAAAKKAGTQGRVIVQFVVERDGTITNAKAVRSVESSMDEEAVRIINTMPKWKPGMQRGKTVRVKFTVPVMFRLE